MLLGLGPFPNMPIGGSGPLTGTVPVPLPNTPFNQEPDQSYYEMPDQFKKIPAGTSLIGEGDDSHSISVNSFEISKYPITNLNVLCQ